jgi:hypothetical protein
MNGKVYQDMKEYLDILFKPDCLCSLEELLIKQEFEEWKKQYWSDADGRKC